MADAKKRSARLDELLRKAALISDEEIEALIKNPPEPTEELKALMASVPPLTEDDQIYSHLKAHPEIFEEARKGHEEIRAGNYIRWSRWIQDR